MLKISYVTLKHRFEDECGTSYYYEYEIEKRKFYDNEEVKTFITLVFSNYFNTTPRQSEEIIETFELWEDKGLFEELLEKYMEELDEIFWDYDYFDKDNDYKKDGAC